MQAPAEKLFQGCSETSVLDGRGVGRSLGVGPRPLDTFIVGKLQLEPGRFVGITGWLDNSAHPADRAWSALRTRA